MLSRNEILRHRNAGNIIISPFVERNVGMNSVDLTLGEWFIRPNPAFQSLAYCPFNPAQASAHWQTPEPAISRARLLAQQPGFADVIGNLAGPFIVVPPRVTFLAHSHEFIGGQNCVATKISARSKVARNGLEICACASHGETGFVDRWVFELYNKLNHPLILPVGMRIGQIEFYLTEPTRAKPVTTKNDLATIESSWSPESLIGNLWADEDIRRLP